MATGTRGPDWNCTDMHTIDGNSTGGIDGTAARRGPLRKLAARVLLRPGSAVFAQALNLGLRRDLPQDVYQQLLGRPVEIAVSDWGVRFRFTATAGGFVSIANAREVDLRFIGKARDFALLAAGDEDADTLYFSRRMVVEGDTELALLIKNTMDAIDGQHIRKLIRRAGAAAERVRKFHDRLRPDHIRI